ncbi:MAG: DNA adenine methylase [Pseudomonadota bacterium]
MPAPQPLPYQGSKRRLAPAILARFPAEVERLVEPFAGSAALSLAAASTGQARRFLLGDVLAPLASLWAEILGDPEALATAYAALWQAQLKDPRGHYDAVRRAFNAEGGAARLLYLLNRCVKGAVRFNRAGEFNQGPDNRRLGARPAVVRARLRAAHALLAGRAEVRAADYAALLAEATPADLVYLDPPWVGVSGTRDARYRQGLDLQRFLAELERANARGLRYLVSLDGRLGARCYGPALPASLGLRRIELPAGRSAQATLHGRVEETFESLYLGPGLGK